MNVPTNEISVNNLPEDSASLKAMLREVLAKLESVSADQQHEKRLAEQLRQRADELYLENLRLQREELADRIHPGTFRTSRACTQKVCVSQLRTCRREPADRSSRQSRNSNRERLCRPRASGFHRDQQVRRLPATLSAGRYFRAARL